MNNTAEKWIKSLKLIPHPEGGYYRETYRSEESCSVKNLPPGYSGDRNFSTAIFYLLEKNQISKFHRLKSDEIFHFYDGDGMIFRIINNAGNLTERKLGINYKEGQIPQILMKAGEWFGAELINPGTYCLAGCTVSPGFHFDDFELGDRDELLEMFPQHSKIIKQLT